MMHVETTVERDDGAVWTVIAGVSTGEDVPDVDDADVDVQEVVDAHGASVAIGTLDADTLAQIDDAVRAVARARVAAAQESEYD